MLKYVLIIAGLWSGALTSAYAQDMVAAPLKWDLQTSRLCKKEQHHYKKFAVGCS
jgi:hypothetical protein